MTQNIISHWIFYCWITFIQPVNNMYHGLVYWPASMWLINRVPFARCLYLERLTTELFIMCGGYSLVKLSGFMSSACLSSQNETAVGTLNLCVPEGHTIWWGARFPSAHNPTLNSLQEINDHYSMDISLRERFLLGHLFLNRELRRAVKYDS